MSATSYRLTDEKAARMIVGFRAGRTLRTFGVKPARLEAYFSLHPEYAAEARPLLDANAKVALYHKGDALRSTTHCRSGLHQMIAENIFMDGTHGRRRCRACRRISSLKASPMSDDIAARVRMALERGASLTLITNGKSIGAGKRDRSSVITSFKIIKRHRRENPEFDRFVVDAIFNRVFRPTQSVALHTHRYEWTHGDDIAIKSMVPEWLADRDDVVNDVMISLLEGRLDRSQVERYIARFVRARLRDFPKKFARFGSSPLVSLDEALFDDGGGTRGDNVSRSLWD